MPLYDVLCYYTRMKTYSISSVSDIFNADNSEELFKEYVKESKSELMPDTLPDRAIYDELESMGLLHCITIRDNNVLIGFVVGIITPNFHHNTKSMTIESIFVQNKHRGYNTAKNAIEKLEEIAKTNGCSTMTLGGRIGHIEKRAKHLGFTPISVVSVKDIS